MPAAHRADAGDARDSKPFSDPDWLYEIKWDGYRVAGGRPRRQGELWTRNLKDAETYFPNLLTPPTWIDAHEAIVDGEVVALDDEGRPDFSLLQARLGDRRRAGRSSTRPSTCSTRRPVAAPASRSRIASGCSRASSGSTRASASRPTSTARGRRSTRPPAAAASRASSPSSAGRATSPAGGRPPGSSSRSGPSRSWSSAAGRRARATPATSGRWPSASTRTASCGSPARSGSGFTGATRKVLLAALGPLEVDAPPFDPPPPRDYRGRWGGDLAGSPGSVRSS